MKPVAFNMNSVSRIDAAQTSKGLSFQIRALQTEASGLASENVQYLLESLNTLRRMAAEIADGGEAYAVGVREIARRLTEDCRNTGQSIVAIGSRA